MTDLEGHVRERTIAGMRWAILFNVATIPLSFATNLLLGRTSPLALGYYGAIQIFVGGFQALLVPGGREVFTRFVPAIDPERRAGFLVRYLAGVLAFAAVLIVAARVVAPHRLDRVLERFGIPSFGLAVAVVAAVIVWAFSSHFLYAVLHGPRAAMTLRSLVVGFFVAAVIGFGPLRGALRDDPAGYLWTATLAIYLCAAVLGLYHLTRTSEIRGPRAPLERMPTGFLAVVGYAHVATVVTFFYMNLVPSVVLAWLDVESLAYLHAALRYGVVLTSLPVALSPVLAPGISALSAKGKDAVGLQHTAAAVRASLLLIFPVVLGLILFAGDAMAIFNPAFRESRHLLRITALAALAGTLVHLGTALAVAVGAFRSYLAASMAFVAGAILASALLVPAFGLVGAAVAQVVGALIQQTSIAVLLRRRLGFRTPSIVWIAWACGLAASGLALAFDPGRWVAAALFVVILAVFAVVGRVRVDEFRRHLARMRGGSAGGPQAP